VADFMFQHGLDAVPSIPTTTRPLDDLKGDADVWNMSRSERATLYDNWYMAASESIRETQVEDFENLRRKHSDALRNWEEIKEQVYR
jgi:hypothetical protein